MSQEDSRTPSHFSEDLQLDFDKVMKEREEVAMAQRSQQAVFDQQYILGDQIGRGHFALVFRAQRREDDMPVVVKLTRSCEPEVMSVAKREYQILTEVKHPKIVHALEFLPCGGGGALVLQNIEDSFTLESSVSAAPGGTLDLSIVRELMRDLFDAVAFIHCKGVIHRDIKVQNMLVSGDHTSGQLRSLYLIDFNTAQRIDDCGCLTLTGTPDYLPPEVLLGDSHSDKSDVWASGICLHYMVYGTLPWQRNDYGSHTRFGQALLDRCAGRKARLYFAEFSEKAPSLEFVHMGPECASLLDECLKVQARPTAGTLAAHPWLGRVSNYP